MPWAIQHEQCVKCGKTEFPHAGRGLCRVCYNFDNEQRHRAHIFHKGKHRRRRRFPIPADELRRRYVDEGMSLIDLARTYNCTRQYILKLLKHYEIERRDKSEARILALRQRKLTVSRLDDTGKESQVHLQKININKKFFKWWSAGMAYVLGVIFTDGNITPGRERDTNYKGPGSRLSIAQKEPELLEKVLALMECDAKIYRGKQALTGNPIHHFSIAI